MATEGVTLREAAGRLVAMIRGMHGSNSVATTGQVVGNLHSVAKAGFYVSIFGEPGLYKDWKAFLSPGWKEPQNLYAVYLRV